MKKYDILTLDIWDTVLSRRCHPDEVKIHTAHVLIENAGKLLRRPKKSAYALFKERQQVEKEIGVSSVNKGFDDEYCLGDVIEKWLSNEIICTVDELMVLSSKLIAEEIEQEKRVTYINESLLEMLEGIDFIELAFISDFYMPSETLAALLVHHGWVYPYNKIYCSCDYKFNKRSGRLFDTVIKEMHVKKNLKHLHIGDNQYSDYIMPRSKNIDALLFLPEEDRVRRMGFDKQFVKRNEFGANYSEVFYQIAEEVTSNSVFNNEAQEFGHRVGFVFISFVLFVMENAIDKKVDCVYYFTREGQFFKQIHDRIRESGLLPFTVPESKLLEVSRIATFGPSLRGLNVEELKRIWNQYSEQSPRAFFSSLDINASIWEPYIEKYQLNPDKKEHLFENAEFLAMLSDAYLNSAIIRNIAKRELLLKAYLTQVGFPDSGNAMIVDIGWRGTIQDNLAYLLPSTNIHGVYLGLQQYLNEQPDNTSKTAWVTNLNSSKENASLLKYVTLLEMLCNGPGGTVTGYIGDVEVGVIRELIKGEDLVYEKFTKHFQDGVFDVVDVFVRCFRDKGLRSIEVQSVAVNLMRKIIQQPEECMVNAYFDLVHNERFGTGELNQKDSNLSVSELLKALWNNEFRSVLKMRIKETGWPQGLIFKNKLPLLLRLYNKRYT